MGLATPTRCSRCHGGRFWSWPSPACGALAVNCCRDGFVTLASPTRACDGGGGEEPTICGVGEGNTPTRCCGGEEEEPATTGGGKGHVRLACTRCCRHCSGRRSPVFGAAAFRKSHVSRGLPMCCCGRNAAECPAFMALAACCRSTGWLPFGAPAVCCFWSTGQLGIGGDCAVPLPFRAHKPWPPPPPARLQTSVSLGASMLAHAAAVRPVAPAGGDGLTSTGSSLTCTFDGDAIFAAAIPPGRTNPSCPTPARSPAVFDAHAAASTGSSLTCTVDGGAITSSSPCSWTSSISTSSSWLAAAAAGGAGREAWRACSWLKRAWMEDWREERWESRSDQRKGRGMGEWRTRLS